jgi:hypothetical protein
MKGGRAETGHEQYQYNNTMQQLEPICECRECNPFQNELRAFKNGKPDAPATTTQIGVRFAAPSMFEIGITHPTNTTKGKQRKNMKTKALLLAALSLTVMALAGCGRQNSEENPAMTNSANAQPMPGAAVSNNVAGPPAFVAGDTNIPTATNATGTTTNQ